MATYYFLGGGTSPTDWNDSSNWYDAPSGGSSGQSPTSSDDVVISSDCTTNSGSTPTVNNLTIGGSNYIDISIGINGTADFNDNSYYGINSNPAITLALAGTLNLNNSASIKNNATVSGGAVYFNSSSTNNGNISSSSVTCTYPLDRNTFNTGTITPTISYSGYQTFYFNAGSDWYTLSNWYLSDLTTNAPYIPGALDDVQINTSLNGTASNMYAKNVTVNGASLIFSSSYTLYVTDTITINSNAAIGDSMNAPNVECTNAIFNGTSYIGGNATLTATGTVSFNDSSELGSSMSGAGNIIGNVNFYSTSEFVSGTLTGNASFNDTSTFTGGTLTGDLTVVSPYTLPFVVGGTLSGDLLYSGYSSRTVYYYHNTSSDDWGNTNYWWTDSAHTVNAGYAPNADIALDNVIIESSIVSNSGTINAIVASLIASGNLFIGIDLACSEANFFDSSIFGQTSGTLTHSYATNNITFHDLSENEGTIVPDASYPVEFRDNSFNTGTVSGNADVYHPSAKPVGGTVTGTVTYYGYTLYFADGGMGNNGDWNDPNNWFLDINATNAYNDVPSEIIPYQDIVLLSDVTHSTGGNPTAANLTNYLTYTNISGISINVDELATLIYEARLNDPVTISGNVLFEDFATNRGGIITGSGTFELTAAAQMIASGYDGTYGAVEFKYGKGVNGSNILGII